MPQSKFEAQRLVYGVNALLNFAEQNVWSEMEGFPLHKKEPDVADDMRDDQKNYFKETIQKYLENIQA